MRAARTKSNVYFIGVNSLLLVNWALGPALEEIMAVCYSLCSSPWPVANAGMHQETCFYSE